ncbi:agmatine deiminase family protein [Streptomyces nigrescens]|uniref:agmatine deiminase family protein n=1 Tax=Streptomyces nigrescens TaxID=1920 RepID=UPI00224F2BBA|nr:agmatine deiminase family protein [Streptomyces libani]MCX5445639.1 agmatine deiminase family protein [Streptomyces libani]
MEISRRQTLQAAAVAALGGALSGCGTPDSDGSAPRETGAAPAAARSAGGRRLPDEAHPHEATYMSWPGRRIWGPDTAGVRADIARLARTIAEFEPVRLLAGDREAKAAQRACGSGVEVVPTPVDDLWMRDTGPVFVLGPDGVAGVDLNFNGWGGKQEHGHDRRVARAILADERLPRIKAPLVSEGGAVEGDGQGTLMVAESSLVNDNRNPGRSREDLERALKDLFGATTVIWVKGVKGKDITDYHIDALARFSAPGVVVLSTPAKHAPRNDFTGAYEQAREVLEGAVDARGKRLEVVELPEPADIGRRGKDFLACYVNYYVANGAVIMPRFGDRKADSKAAAVLREQYPGREVVQLPVDNIGEGGGGIHCSTQQLPKAG